MIMRCKVHTTLCSCSRRGLRKASGSQCGGFKVWIPGCHSSQYTGEGRASDAQHRTTTGALGSCPQGVQGQQLGLCLASLGSMKAASNCSGRASLTYMPYPTPIMTCSPQTSLPAMCFRQRRPAAGTLGAGHLQCRRLMTPPHSW